MSFKHIKLRKAEPLQHKLNMTQTIDTKKQFEKHFILILICSRIAYIYWSQLSNSDCIFRSTESFTDSKKNRDENSVSRDFNATCHSSKTY